MWKNNVKKICEKITLRNYHYKKILSSTSNIIICVVYYLKKLWKNHYQWKFLKNQTLWTEIFHQGFQQAVILCYYLLQEENENIISVFEEKEKISNLQFEKEDIIKKY